MKTMEEKVRDFVAKLQFTEAEIKDYAKEFQLSEANMRRMAERITRELKHDLEKTIGG